MARTDWASTPTVFISRAACPWCGSPRHNITRTDQNGDASTTRFCVCVDCNERFKTVVELSPAVGDSVLWPE